MLFNSIPLSTWLDLIKTKFKDWPVKPSSPDSRDWPLQAITDVLQIPDAVSLRHHNTGVLNQYQSPLCAAYSATAILHAYYKLPPGTLSPRFVYWQAKLIDGIPDQDGTTLRAVLQVVQKIGACPESLCPSWPDWSRPVFTPEMMAEAAKYRIKAYARLNVGTLVDVEAAIASGRMVLAGSLVTSDDWADGWILRPEGMWRGGHATVFDQYNKGLSFEGYQRFTGGPNSWGPDWGIDGFYEMAEAYATWKDKDFGLTALWEAWAVEFEQAFAPKIPAQVFEFDSAPVIDPATDRTMLELRGLANVTGAQRIDWDNAEQKVTLEYPDRTVVLWIGKKEYQVAMK